jgi:hypothetical protein
MSLAVVLTGEAVMLTAHAYALQQTSGFTLFAWFVLGLMSDDR